MFQNKYMYFYVSYNCVMCGLFYSKIDKNEKISRGATIKDHSPPHNN